MSLTSQLGFTAPWAHGPVTRGQAVDSAHMAADTAQRDLGILGTPGAFTNDEFHINASNLAVELNDVALGLSRFAPSPESQQLGADLANNSAGIDRWNGWLINAQHTNEGVQPDDAATFRAQFKPMLEQASAQASRAAALLGEA